MEHAPGLPKPTSVVAEHSPVVAGSSVVAEHSPVDGGPGVLADGGPLMDAFTDLTVIGDIDCGAGGEDIARDFTQLDWNTQGTTLIAQSGGTRIEESTVLIIMFPGGACNTV